MIVEVKSLQGGSVGSVDLHDSVFNVKVSDGAIYHSIVNELANKRQGTAKTKTRSEVLYSGRKPWRQKGTGRARAGTRRSPIWVGGGTMFGPIPKDYSYNLPKKMKRLAFKSVLSNKLSLGEVVVIENIAISSGKTKEANMLLMQFNPNKERSVLVLNDQSNETSRAFRNIPWVRVYSYNRMLLKDLFYAKKILITKDAIELLNQMLLGIEKEVK